MSDENGIAPYGFVELPADYRRDLAAIGQSTVTGLEDLVLAARDIRALMPSPTDDAAVLEVLRCLAVEPRPDAGEVMLLARSMADAPG